MLPVLPPTVAQVPQAVDMSSVLTTPSDAALGRLPLRVVPQTVNASKPDQQGTRQQARPSVLPETPATPSKTSSFDALINAGKGEIRLPSPFSTTFLAQLFGQMSSMSTENSGAAAIWLNASTANEAVKDSGMLEYERLEEQLGQVKYAPSGAKMTEGSLSNSIQEWRSQAAQVVPFRRTSGKQGAASVFNSGQAAYASAQSRGLSQAAASSQAVSIRF